MAMHFKEYQLLRSGKKIYYRTLQRQTRPSGLKEAAGSGVLEAAGPPPALPLCRRRLLEAGPQSPVLPREPGSSSSLQDGTGYDSPVCAPASLIFPSFQKQIERSLI